MRKIDEAMPEPTEFTKEIREYLQDFIYAEENGVAMQHDPRCLERDLMQACDIIDAKDAEIERLTDLFYRLRTWQQAYPLEVFPKPDLKKAHNVLRAAGMTLDAISADAMRHVLDGIRDIVEQALKPDGLDSQSHR